jgi:hypothetical protein
MLSLSSGAEMTRPLLPCLVTSAYEDGGSTFLRNVGIDLKINTVPKPKTSNISSQLVTGNIKQVTHYFDIRDTFGIIRCSYIIKKAKLYEIEHLQKLIGLLSLHNFM